MITVSDKPEVIHNVGVTCIWFNGGWFIAVVHISLRTAAQMFADITHVIIHGDLA
jgi:hypothetical protein